MRELILKTCSQLQRSSETYVFVFEETEHLQLPEDSFAAHEALKDIRQFFQGHSPTIPRICHCPANYKGKRVINKIKDP